MLLRQLHYLVGALRNVENADQLVDSLLATASSSSGDECGATDEEEPSGALRPGQPCDDQEEPATLALPAAGP